MTKRPALKRQTLAEQIKEALISDIAAGTLPPGARLTEMKIAEEMQTSQAPVRDALRELESLGLIEVQRNKGSFVREIDLEEIANIYAVRAELEGHAIEQSTNVALELATTLRSLCNQMEEAGQDLARFAALNAQFHRAIVQASGNRTLIEIWERLDIQTRTLTNLARPGRDLAQVNSDHRAIADLVAGRMLKTAREHLQRHIISVVGTHRGS